ncbi:hypothetical protein [Prosthecobacter sp.]|uniref:hypothetical protein n=1 Tax=Prosthecobacter sp. TaxID=1965333 RepID=UPI0037845800
MIRFATLSLGLSALLLCQPTMAQAPSKEASAQAIARHPELGKVGSPFNVEFLRRLKIHSAEDSKYLTDKSWPLKLADEVAKVIDTYAAKPEIEFKVLLIIKRISDTTHPLLLPVRAEMTEEDVQAARHCFEIQTPDMVHEATHGKVRFIPTVIVSDKPLRCFNPSRRDSAEYLGEEMINELAAVSKPGEYDSVGYYFLHYDSASGYLAPRAGYGVGGYNGSAGIGMFAISSAGHMNPRDEIFVHEWIHGLDGYYGGFKDVRLPKGALHGGINYDAHYGIAKVWRPQDTFKGYMAWYKDILNAEVPESEGFSGHGSKAWKHGPMREEGRKRGPKFPIVDLPVSEYPEWVYALMKGDISKASLFPVETAAAVKPGAITAGQKPWSLESWAKAASTTARYAENDGGILTLECERGDHASLLQEAAVQPSTNYILTAEVKTTRVKIEQAGGKFTVLLEANGSHTSKDLLEATDWTPVVLPFTTKPDQSTTTLRLQMGGPGSLCSGKVQFRQVKLQKVGYPATRLLRTAAR